MNYWTFLILPLLIFTTPIFGQTSSDELSNSEYVLEIDEHIYSISYVVNADIIAMEIDPESRSLLIGLDNTFDSQFFIGLEHELISDSDSSTFEFFVPIGSEEVEIIGTNVIPEFPVGAIFGFVVMISLIMVFAKVKAPFFKL